MSIYQASINRYGHPPVPAHCRGTVYDQLSRNFSQCSRRAAVFRCIDGAEIGFCRQHDPEAVAARYKARDQEYRRKRDESNAKYDREQQERNALAEARKALEAIVAGHNDPRQLAADVLALFPAPEASPEAN